MKTFWNLRDDLKEVHLCRSKVQLFERLKKPPLLPAVAFDSPMVSLVRRFKVVQNLSTDSRMEFVEGDYFTRAK